MADKTGIQWTEATWNPIAGCSLASPGCTNCYAMREVGGFLSRTGKYAGLAVPSKAGPVWTGEVRLWEPALQQPRSWKRPRRIFVNSMSDLFHEAVPEDWIDRINAVMALCPQHQFQVLTKRDERMREYLTRLWADHSEVLPWPLPNVWVGVSVEDRARLGRVDQLRATPAAVRFLSLEPLLEDLGPLDLSDIDWVIVGGESGPGARPFNIEWARSIIAQCKAAGVACFVKQLGRYPVGESPATFPEGSRARIYQIELRHRKGGDPAEWPEDLCVREYPP